MSGDALRQALANFRAESYVKGSILSEFFKPRSVHSDAKGVHYEVVHYEVTVTFSFYGFGCLSSPSP